MDMFRNRAHILHNEFRTAKHSRIETLENEPPLLPGIESHEKRVVDIAVPEGLNAVTAPIDVNRPAMAIRSSGALLFITDYFHDFR